MKVSGVGYRDTLSIRSVDTTKVIALLVVQTMVGLK